MATVANHPDGDMAQRLAALDWPAPPEVQPGDPEIDFRKALYQAQLTAYTQWLQATIQAELDAQKAAVAAQTTEQQAELASQRARDDAQTADDNSRRAAAYANYYTVFQSVQSAYLSAANGAITSAQTRAQFVATAAGAIATLYTGLLGLVFGLSSPGHIMPVRGIWAGVFLGLALVLATFYWSYLTKQLAGEPIEPDASIRVDAIQRVYAFLTWSRDTVLARRYALQCSVISLGVGVAFLPVAFTGMSNTTASWLALAGAVVVFAIPRVANHYLHD